MSWCSTKVQSSPLSSRTRGREMGILNFSWAPTHLNFFWTSLTLYSSLNGYMYLRSNRGNCPSTYSIFIFPPLKKKENCVLSLSFFVTLISLVLASLSLFVAHRKRLRTFWICGSDTAPHMSFLSPHQPTSAHPQPLHGWGWGERCRSSQRARSQHWAYWADGR